MENRAQTILHLNSHGSKAQVQTLKSANNSFGNLSNMPITDVNKIGLMYVSIPRQWDILQDENNNVEMEIFTNLGIPFTLKFELPLLNYYDSTQFIIDERVEITYEGSGGNTTTVPDKSNDRSADKICYVEMLTTLINAQMNTVAGTLDGADEDERYEKYFLEAIRCLVTTDNEGKLRFNWGQDSSVGNLDAVARTSIGSEIRSMRITADKRMCKYLGLPLGDPIVLSSNQYGNPTAYAELKRGKFTLKKPDWGGGQASDSPIYYCTCPRKPEMRPPSSLFI